MPVSFKLERAGREAPPIIHSTLSAHSQLLMTDILVNNKKLRCLCDTGAEVNLLPLRFANRHGLLLNNLDGVKPVSVDQTPVNCSGVTFTSVKIGTSRVSTKFYVVEGIDYGILSFPLLSQLGAIIDCNKNTVSINGMPITNIPPTVQDTVVTTARVCRVQLTTSTVIHPGQEKLLSAKLVGQDDSPFEGIVEPTPEFVSRTGLAVAAVKVPKGQTTIPVCVANVWDHPIKVWRCQTVANLSETDMTSEPTSPSELVAPYDPVLEAHIGAGLSFEQKDKLKQLLRTNGDIFESSSNQGLTDTLHHNIDITTDEPINTPPRRLPLGCVSEVNEKIGTLYREGKIEPSNSPWAFPIVPVRKKDGSIRICVDYRPLNKVTVADTFPTGNIQDCLDKLSDASYFSTIDLAQGYMQVPLSPKDKEKTAFRSPVGLWQWTRMPQGLKNSPATWCRLMQKVFNTIPTERLILYMDDICVVSNSFEDHLRRLQEVFDCLRQHGLKIKAKKCHLAKDEVVWLGHKVSRAGVTPDREKVSAVCQWQTLTNVKEVQTFLGVCGWWRKFVPNYADIANPLYKLLEKDKFNWNEHTEHAFQTLKKCLMTAPILAHPDISKEFIVMTDASEVAVGGALLQEHSLGTLMPVAYFSRALTKRERGYSTYDREAIAIRDTLHRFRHYLLGRPFLLRTDHKPLVYISEMKDPYGRRGRLLADIQEYNFTVQHVRGTDNSLADALSRIGYGKDKKTDKDFADKECQTDQAVAAPIRMVEDAGKSGEQTMDLKTWQQTDRDTSKVMMWMTKEEHPPKPSDMPNLAQKALYREWLAGKLVIIDGILRRRFELPGRRNCYLQVVVPQAYTKRIFHELHEEQCHMGIQKTLLKIKMRYYWPRMTADVEKWCQECNICQRRQNPNPKPRTGLQQIVSTRPGEVVHADILELTKTEQGNKYVLVLMDSFTKYVNVYPLANQKAETVADILSFQYMPEHGAIEQLHTDQGGSFDAKIVKEICTILETRKTRTTGYHPQSNGLVERFNRTLIAMLTKHQVDHPADWDKHLSLVATAYNTSVHDSTGYTPFFLTHGREMRLPTDLMIPVPLPDSRVGNITTHFAKTLKETLFTAFHTADNFLDGARKRQKHGYDKWAKEHSFAVGDRVWLFDPTARRGRANKLVLPWVGPYIIKKRFDVDGKTGVTYRIKLENGRRQLVVHHNRLKSCCGQEQGLLQKENESLEKDCSGANPTDMEVTVELTNETIEPREEEITTPDAQPDAVRTRSGRLVKPPDRFM